MRVTKWGEFGILCSLFLASRYNEDHSIGASEIAESQSIPLDYTHQILHRLRKGDILTSTRGPQGGYTLSRNPEAITLREILLAAEGDTFEVICDTNPVYGESCGHEKACGLREIWKEIKVSIDALLEERTLADLLSRHSQIVETTLVPIGSSSKEVSSSLE